MASILSILRRIGGLKAAPATGSAGQLALWKAGAKPTDAASLYAHDGTQWVEVLDTSAQWTSDGSGNINRAAGNVGIGVPTPTEALDVNGSFKVSGAIVINNATPHHVIQFNDGAARLGYVSGNSALKKIVLCAEDPLYGVSITTKSTERVTILPDGQIGVGTPTPKAWFEINSRGKWGGNNYGKSLYVTANGATNPAIGISDASGGNNIAFANTNGRLTIAHMPAITDETSPPIPRVTVAANGHIGLGEGDPHATVDVKGSCSHNAVGTSSVMDLALGQIFTSDGTAGNTYSFANVPASRATTVVLRIGNGGAKPQVFPAGIHWLGGSPPTLAAGKNSVIVFFTDDGGTNWWGNLVGEAA